MASFSFGGERLRGFCNAGVYGVIFVYGKNDPWTGAAPDADAIQSTPMLEMVIDPMATHQDYFLHESEYEPSSRQTIIEVLTKFLK